MKALQMTQEVSAEGGVVVTLTAHFEEGDEAALSATRAHYLGLMDSMKPGPKLVPTPATPRPRLAGGEDQEEYGATNLQKTS